MSNRRLIEDSLPLGEISQFSAKEKSIRHGHISTLHLWWARRPLAAARAATLAALLPAPKTEAERAKLHELITSVLDWDLVKDPPGFAKRLRKSLVEHTGRGDWRILDPFAGGGTLPLEAERIGADAFATDLNPVAHIIEKATLGYPQHFCDILSVSTAEDQHIKRSRLVAEVQRWGNVVQGRVLAEVGELYKSSERDESLFWIWSRTVSCANPACRAEIPLVGSYFLIRKPDYIVALEPKVFKGRVEFSIVENPSFDPSEGLVSRGHARCLVCSETTSSQHVKAQGKSVGLGHRLIAVAVRDGTRGKRYRTATAAERKLAEGVAAPTSIGPLSAVPDEPLPLRDTRAFFPVLYGLTTWGSLFNPRQLRAMDAFARNVAALRKEVLDANSDLGARADAFSDAVMTYLGLCVSKLSDFSSTICVLNYTGGRGVKNTFRMNALPMTWDYAETNPFNQSAAGWPKIVEDLTQTLSLLEFPGRSTIQRASADTLPFENKFFDAIVTDPPYYDAVPYSDLSDYFYVWLRRALHEVHPEALATSLTPKRSEMVQNPAQDKSSEFFETAMSKAFAEMHRTLKDDGILVLVFAHKATSAWETLLKALLDNNLVVTASWPIETEKPGRTRAIDSAALASSVFIVCRKRSAHDDGFLDDVEPNLKSRLHERLDYFWSQGIRGADFFMSAIGPAVEVFGRHKRVLKLSGEEVTIAELLDKVRGIVADYALQRIVHGEAAGNVDEASRFYVIWRWAYGTSEVESGEAIHMAQSMGCEFSELVADSGVLTKSGDTVTLKGPVYRKKTKGLGEPGATGVLAPLIDVLHRAANVWAAGERQDLADFLATALPTGGVDRMQRLAQSIVDVLPPGDKERALYENFLVGARSLPTPTKKNEAAERQRKLI
jgi:putative DNA methylase